MDPAEGTTSVLASVANKGDVPAMAAAIVSGSPTMDVGVGFEVLKMGSAGMPRVVNTDEGHFSLAPPSNAKYGE